jgi:hypothetical protein
MGAMRRVARFFSPSTDTASKREQCLTYDRSGGNSREDVVTVNEYEWRRAPEKFLELSRRGQTVKVCAPDGRLLVQIERQTVIKDPATEKEVRLLLENCDARTALSGSWFD